MHNIRVAASDVVAATNVENIQQNFDDKVTSFRCEIYMRPPLLHRPRPLPPPCCTDTELLLTCIRMAAAAQPSAISSGVRDTQVEIFRFII